MPSTTGLEIRGGKKMLLNWRDCANDFVIKAFEYGNGFDTFG